MIDFPNCKLNLGLSVINKRADGFHNIETVMMPVNITDILEIIISPEKQFRFKITGLEITGSLNDNLVIKAYELMKSGFDLPPVEIHLHKIIPFGSGMGGGSADAAFTIRMLNTLFRLNLTHQIMEDYARELGSDCAFFIGNKPVFAHGKGDEFEAIDISVKNYFITVVKPEINISTREAYSFVRPFGKGQAFRQIINLPVDQWKGLLVNDFENALFEKYPQIRTIKEKLYESGAVYSSMTGSGSAVFGIFKSHADVKNHFPGCKVFTDCKFL
jgi:4-diphosphocytidyl-2-C-methyl-D-erythritol kinase